MNNLREHLENRLKALKVIQDRCKITIENSPNSSIYVVHNQGTNQYYRVLGDSKIKKYIRKSNMKLVKSLIQAEYSKKIMKTTTKQIQRIEKVLDVYKDESLIDIYENTVLGKKEFVEPFEISDRAYAIKWENNLIKLKEEINAKHIDKYNINELSEEKVIITEKGEKVRSKSEKILADKLKLMEIPYVYEVPVYLKGWGYVRPDFKVLNIKTRKEYIWEHLGMMDIESYCKNNVDKIRRYQKNGLVVGDNLILTFETSMQPISTKDIEIIINKALK